MKEQRKYMDIGAVVFAQAPSEKIFMSYPYKEWQLQLACASTKVSASISYSVSTPQSTSVALLVKSRKALMTIYTYHQKPILQNIV